MELEMAANILEILAERQVFVSLSILILKFDE